MIFVKIASIYNTFHCIANFSLFSFLHFDVSYRNVTFKLLIHSTMSSLQVEYEGYDCGRNGIVSVPEEPTKKVLESTKSSSQLNQNSHREETSWWVAEEGGHQDIRERDKGVAVAGELACLAGYMAGYLKAAGATCAPTGTPQYHAHGHPAMGVGTHPHPHSHPHPGAPHPGLHSPFTLTTHGHPHPHPLEHGLAAFPQGKSLFFFYRRLSVVNAVT